MPDDLIFPEIAPSASKNVKLSSEGADSLREKEIFAPFEPRINKGGKER